MGIEQLFEIGRKTGYAIAFSSAQGIARRKVSIQVYYDLSSSAVAFGNDRRQVAQKFSSPSDQDRFFTGDLDWCVWYRGVSLPKTDWQYNF